MVLFSLQIFINLISKAMYGVANKHYKVSITALAFCLVFVKKKVKRHFLISNFSEGHTTLCRVQHVACEPRVEYCALDAPETRFVEMAGQALSSRLVGLAVSCYVRHAVFLSQYKS